MVDQYGEPNNSKKEQGSTKKHDDENDKIIKNFLLMYAELTFFTKDDATLINKKIENRNS